MSRTVTNGAITYNGKTTTTQSTGDLSVKYGDICSTTLSGSSSYSIACNGKIMRAPVTIGGLSLECEGKLMKGDIGITTTATTYYTLSITGTGSNSTFGTYAKVIVNGTEYTSAATVEVTAGTTIELWVSGKLLRRGDIYVDGSQVSKTSSTTTYSLTINKDRTLKMSGYNGGIAGKVEAT